jgi:sugar lactone lactonase YvrE
MNTSITSNWRPLLRAVSAFLTAFAALAANASAQTTLYVSAFGFGLPPSGTVTAYDPNSGTVLSGSGFPITGFNVPVGLAIGGNTLYVADRSTGTVTAYDAGKGTPAKNFMPITKLKKPSGLAVDGSVLYVSSYESGTVTAYDANSGAVDQGFKQITGLNKPSGLAVGPGHILYVASCGTSFNGGTVGAYDNEGDAFEFNPLVTGLSVPSGLASAGNVLYVAEEGSGTVAAYTLDATGFKSATPIPNFNPPGLTGPTGLVVTNSGNGGNLFVVSTGNGTVREYNAKTGAPINPSFLSNLPGPTGIAVK